MLTCGLGRYLGRHLDKTNKTKDPLADDPTILLLGTHCRKISRGQKMNISVLISALYNMQREGKHVTAFGREMDKPLTRDLLHEITFLLWKSPYFTVIFETYFHWVKNSGLAIFFFPNIKNVAPIRHWGILTCVVSYEKCAIIHTFPPFILFGLFSCYFAWLLFKCLCVIGFEQFDSYVFVYFSSCCLCLGLPEVLGSVGL